ncbi:hypothetical protein C8A00DRAFT_18509 [Chaetomidium leptoderma]|uniref:Uncharacterized protein n=1 Tax=Chaetomidium leptoderma TaxID=669021 RepID=A0AAN6ZT09_9PEZI|nr:hypothetical protein C8A00DRAFT_18509 [Chaetomidium leptoderma]
MGNIIRLTPHLTFPNGDVDLAKVAMVHVTVPLPLIKYMDILDTGLTGQETSKEVERKAEPVLHVIQKRLLEAMFDKSGSQWPVSDSPFVSVHRPRGKEDRPVVAVSFVMHRTDIDSTLAAEVYCKENPSGGRLDCQVAYSTVRWVRWSTDPNDPMERGHVF